MTSRSDGQAVFVEAAARLHFGVLDLRGAHGRWFGGIGAAAPAPTLLVSAGVADGLEVDGGDADRAAEFARRFLAHHRLPGGARLCVHRTFPSHAGLGSGTQLALAVARALAEVHRVPTDARGLARSVGRAPRSAIGTWTFAGGGLVLEGGRRPRAKTPPRCSPGCRSLHPGGASLRCRTPHVASVVSPKRWRLPSLPHRPNATLSASLIWC